jgi:hypothetical protein
MMNTGAEIEQALEDPGSNILLMLLPKIPSIVLCLWRPDGPCRTSCNDWYVEKYFLVELYPSDCF